MSGQAVVKLEGVREEILFLMIIDPAHSPPKGFSLSDEESDPPPPLRVTNGVRRLSINTVDPAVHSPSPPTPISHGGITSVSLKLRRPFPRPVPVHLYLGRGIRAMEGESHG